MVFRIVVCDDEEYFRLREKRLIEEYMKRRGYACQVDLYLSGKELSASGSVICQYDVIFLDINMEEMDGIETAERIREISPDVYIVFVTAYITYALEGYKVNAVRYLLKEDSSLEGAVAECLDTILARMDDKRARGWVEVQNGKKRIPVESVLYVESRMHKVKFFVLEDGVKEYCRYGKLDVAEQELRQYGFCRTHQSFLVNMKYVRDIVRYTASLDDGVQISISKKYYKAVEKEYIRMRGDS